MTTADALHRLAESYGVEAGYDDDQGRPVRVAPESLLAVLRVLGAPISRVENAPDAIRARRLATWRLPVDPVAVAWDGVPGPLTVRFPARTPGAVAWRLELEGGGTRSGSADLPAVGGADVEGVAFQTYRLAVPGPLPFGYHRLHIEAGGRETGCTVLAAPRRAYAAGDGARAWGAFLPLYALRSARDWGAGDFTDLDNLIGWVRRHGGGLVGTLPLLAAFLDEPCEPSPYSPASRLFWNEFYLDVERVPELQASPRARDFLASGEFSREWETLRAADLVDYPRGMALKRRVLGLLADEFFRAPSPRREAFDRFVAASPRLADYAAFRATGERHRASWWVWPERQRGGDLREGDYDEADRHYHLYVQWLADEQLRRLADRARASGPGLYLDLPLGVNSDSYDVWRERPAFALGASGGAPPDGFFTRGQDWGFPPPHPDNIRADGYRYLRACLANHMRYAGMLRIDHLMGLHRLYWVPHGLGARHGAYVRYQAEELYAVFSIESNRHRTMLVGEDLGTVPPEVRPAMSGHNVRRLYVGQYEARAGRPEPFPPPAPGSVASLNTHDMPTFAAFWRGLDLQDRADLGLLDEPEVRAEAGRREAIRNGTVRMLRRAGLLGDDDGLPAVLAGLLQWLAGSEAEMVLANLEDFWQATEPQNVPGTWRERPNWRRRAAVPLEAFDAVPGLVGAVVRLNAALDRNAPSRKNLE